MSDGATLSNSGWLDVSGKGRNSLVPVGTVTYEAAGLSDQYPCFYLSGSGTSLQVASGGTPYTRNTVVMVLRWDECNCAGTCGVPLRYPWDFREDWKHGWLYGAGSVKGSSVWYGQRWINSAEYADFSKDICPILQGTAYHPTEPIILIWEAKESNVGASMTLFSRYTGSENARAKVAEVQIYDGPLSDSDRTSLECQLASKWGVSGISCPSATEAAAESPTAAAVNPNPAGFSANAKCTGSDGYLWASGGSSCAFGNADGTPLEVDYTASTYTTYSFDMKMRNAPTNGGIYPHGGFKPCNLDGAGQSRGSSPELWFIDRGGDWGYGMYNGGWGHRAKYTDKSYYGAADPTDGGDHPWVVTMKWTGSALQLWSWTVNGIDFSNYRGANSGCNGASSTWTPRIWAYNSDAGFGVKNLVVTQSDTI